MKRRKISILITAALLVMTSLCFLLFACGKDEEESTPPTDSVSICLLPPAEGSPEDFGGLENIGYIAGKLRLQPYFHSTTVGLVDTMVTQDIYGYKDYKNGVLIATSISVAHSNLAPSSAIQKFFGDGKVVVRRADSDDPDDWNGQQTTWSTGTPSEILAKDAYTERYGVWGNELTDYVINAESLVACSSPVKGEDGVYTMTAQLHPELSTYYYKKQMKTMGNLKNAPVFDSVELTFRFQEDWTLLSYDIHEKYTTRVSIINAKCDATMTLTFSYDEASVDVSAYEGYFKQYADVAAPVEPQPEPERTVTDYLAEGFAPLLSGESCLQFTASVADKTFTGKLAPDLQIEPSLQLNKIQLSTLGIDAELSGGELFFRYQDLNAKLALADVQDLLASAPVEMQSFDAEALLESLTEAPIAKADGKAVIDAELDVAGLPVQITFVFDDGEEIRLESVEASLDFGDNTLALSAELAANEGFAELEKEEAVDVAPYIDAVKSLMETEELAFAAQFATNVEGKDLSVAVSGYAVLEQPIEVYIAADVAFGQWTERVEVLYKNEDVTLVYGGVQMQVRAAEIALLTEELSALLGGDEGLESGALALMASEAFSIEKILQTITLYSQAESEVQKLGAVIRLSEWFELEISDLDARAYVQEGALCLETDLISVADVEVLDVFLSVGAAEACSAPDYTALPVCENVLAFALAGYRAFMETEYAELSLSYADEAVDMRLAALAQFRADEGGARSVINLDATVELTAYSNGGTQEDGTHFLHLTILEEQAWISYSMKQLDAPTAVYVTLPVSELFVAGSKLLPVLSPLLGISSEEVYYDCLVQIFSGAHAVISTDLIGEMTLEEWLSLVVKAATVQPAAIAEEVNEEAGEEAGEEALPTEASAVTVYRDENGNLSLSIDASGVQAKVSALQYGAQEIVAPTAPSGKKYIDISTIAILLTDVLNAYEYADQGYALSGSISLSLGSWSLKNVDLQLQIDTRDGIIIHAILAPKDGTVTTITFQDGYFYLTRVVKESKYDWFTKYNVTTTEHRAMTAAQFSEDMMKQIYFILNLSSMEQTIIDTAMGSSGNSGAQTNAYDTGEMVKDYSYTASGESGSYYFSLNLGAIVNDSAFGDLNATITRAQVAGKEYYDLTRIEATVGISVLSANLSLTHDSAIDAAALQLGKIDAHLAELLTGLEYSDFAALNAAAEQGVVSKASQSKVKA